MKAGIVATALAGSAAALHHRHAHHAALFERGGTELQTCIPGCQTIYTTITGEAALHTPPPSSTTVAPTTGPPTVPTPVPETCPTPGVYSWPATTLTLTETTTVVAASSTQCAQGTHTLGGVTTVVVSETTVTCPYATVKTGSAGVVTSTIDITTYVCPSAGTYTIAPTTVTVTDTVTDVIVPVVSTYWPGTYTKSEVITTITETETTVWCPFSTPTTAPLVSSSPAPPPPAASSAAPAPASGSGVLCNGHHITYTGYTTDASGSCKSAEEVLSDLTDLKSRGFCGVRIYATDCSQLTNVGNACRQLGLEMIIGVFLNAPGCDASIGYIAEQITDITTWLPSNLDLVKAIVVGNEVLHNGYCAASDLATLITAVKGACQGVGYTGPFTTSDTVDQWQVTETQTELCEVVDIVGYNAYPFFNAQCTPDNAGDFVYSQYQIMNAMCGSKPCMNLESGWSSDTSYCVGTACGSEANQQAAILAMIQAVSQYGFDLFFSSEYNDLWKQPSTEQAWGCVNDGTFPVIS